MKTKVLLVAIALLGAMSFQAQTPVTLSQMSSPITNGSLLPTASGVLIWGDYNNDGLLDGFMVAGQGISTTTSALYKNNGNGTFTKTSDNFGDWNRASAAWIDYNNDGNLDLVIIGSKSGVESAALYQNLGEIDDFAFDKDATQSSVLPSVAIEDGDHGGHTICAFDYNNDGWTDLLINGQTPTNWQGQGRVVALFKNDQGSFQYQDKPVSGEGFKPVNGGAAHVGDVNNDGYADLLVSGWYDTASNGATFLYINDKNGGFTIASQPAFTGHQQGTNFFVDVNNDGWQDIIEIGRDISNNWNGFTNLFINNQGNGFTKSAPFSGGASQGVAVGDINNDGFIDLFVAGWATNSKIEYGKGDGTFQEQALANNNQARSGDVSFVDLNNDNSLDATIFGYSDNLSGYFTGWFTASGAPANAAPSAPASASATKNGSKYTVTWEAGSDDHTPVAALRYNVAVAYADGTTYAYVPADIATGKVKVNNDTKPFLTASSLELTLPEGSDIYVQTIDQTGLGSVFVKAGSGTVGIREIANDVKVSADNRNIRIAADNAAPYSVISVGGQTLASGVCVKAANIAVESGVYIVKTVQGNAVKTQKILVY